MPIRTEKNGPVTTVIMDRPEARNAMDAEHAQALHDALVAFDADDSASVAVLWGAGGAFCSGWDLKSAAAYADREVFEQEMKGRLAIPDDDDTPMPRGPMGPTRLQLSKPVIAAIEGPAVAGGMEIAIWADCRVMAGDAYFGVFCRRWGVPLIDGGTLRLPRLVGQGRAMEIILTGRKVDAEEALRIGLAERVVAPGTVRAEAEAMAAEIARFPQATMRADRASVQGAWGCSEREGLRREWNGSIETAFTDGLSGAGRFAGGRGRGGDFGEI